MDELPLSYDIENLAQLRAVSDPLRSRVFDALTLEAKTATQVAEELDEAAPKIHYHVRELERVGLVRQVDTRERGGILEKYFRAVARSLRAPPSLFQQAPSDELGETLQGIFDDLTLEAQAALQRFRADNFAHMERDPFTLGQVHIWMTPDEYLSTLDAALNLFRAYTARRGVPNERDLTITFIGFETPKTRGENMIPTKAEAPATSPSSTPQGEQAAKKAHKSVVIGMVVYSRRELEDLADRGEKLDLTVIGGLSFADDITAELIEQTIARIKLYGVINAQPAARAALQTKQV